uniref:PCQ3_101 n=2 Tax=Streptomyces sp. W9 TaxID=682410 RepID=D0UZF0_9ACTN|nr:pCQ3_101 [Streptomyces sp. W9]
MAAGRGVGGVVACGPVAACGDAVGRVVAADGRSPAEAQPDPVPHPDQGDQPMSARDALNAYVAHESDADQAEYEKHLDAYAAEVRAEALREAAERLRNVHASSSSQTWNWWDAAEIPGACADLIDPDKTGS